MKKKISIIIAILLIWFSETSLSQTLHAVCFANTFDRTIGTDVDMLNFKNQMSNLEQFIGYKVKLYEYPGALCKRNYLENCLRGLNTSSDDIIVFYYSGHGGRPSDYQDPFPYMCLTENLSSNYVPVSTVRQLLSVKSARLKIIITDCCNADGSGEDKGAYSKEATFYNKSTSENFKKLFLTTRGEIVITSSKAGQLSLGNSTYGGLMTRNLFSVLIEVGNGIVPPTWESVLQKTKQKCEPRQTPFWIINSTVSPQNTQPSPPHQNVVVADQPDFANAMVRLIDVSKNIGDKYRWAESIFNQYFTSDAEIVVLGQDLETVVRRKKALTYLQELCGTPNIVQVNILYEENANNSTKKDYMVVHEVYQQKIY